MPDAVDIAYGSVVSTSLDVDVAVARVKAFLKDEGWDVLFDLDVQSLLAEKAGTAFRPYRLVGACNPNFALEAFEYEDHFGLVLPCNIAVSRDDDRTRVAVVNAHELFRLTNNGMLTPLGERIDQHLSRVLARLPD